MSDSLVSTCALNWGSSRVNSPYYRNFLAIWRNIHNASTGEKNHQILKENFKLVLEPLRKHVKSKSIDLCLPNNFPECMLPGGAGLREGTKPDVFNFESRLHDVLLTDYRACSTKIGCGRPGHRLNCGCTPSLAPARHVTLEYVQLFTLDYVGAADVMLHVSQNGADGGIGLWIKSDFLQETLKGELDEDMEVLDCLNKPIDWKQLRTHPVLRKLKFDIPFSSVRRMDEEVQTGLKVEAEIAEVVEKAKEKELKDSTIQRHKSKVCKKHGGRKGVPLLEGLIDHYVQLVPCSLHGGKINAMASLMLALTKFSPDEEFTSKLKDAGADSTKHIWDKVLGTHEDGKRKSKKAREEAKKTMPTTTGIHLY